MSRSSAFWLTPRRLRAHGTILALCLWSFYVWNIATPGLLDRNGNLKGTDFLHLYTLGLVATEPRGELRREPQGELRGDLPGKDLYDMNAQAALAAQRVPESAGIRYLPLYPPQVSILFAPLAHLSYGRALAVWWVFSGALYGFCCYRVWRACPRLQNYGGLVFILAIAFPAFFHLIAWGQTAALALVCFTLMYFLLRARREFLAGLVLGCLIFKPQLGLAAAIVFISLAAWRIVAAAALSAAAQLSVGILYYGMEPLRRWLAVLRSVPSVLPLLEPKLYQTHSLRTFWSLLVPWSGVAFALYVVSAIVVLGLTIACWKLSESLALRYSSLLLATVLLAPHLTVYDLVILAPAFLLLADSLVAEPESALSHWLGTLLYFVYVLPLVGPLARWTHLQLSVVAMAASLYVIWTMNGRTPSPET